MRKPAVFAASVLLAALAGLAPSSAAQTATPVSSGPSTDSYDRLFLSFAEDAVIADRQWWEGQVEYSDGEVVEASLVRGVVAFEPWRDVEIGGRVGFGSTDTPRGLPDGSGGTDFDLWGKYLLGTDSKDTDYVVGGMLTIPTGDDTAGLGNDAFGLAAFGSLRYRLRHMHFSAHLGARVNGDAKTLGLPERDGEVSALAGAAVIVPLEKGVSVVGELNYEGGRFDGADDDVRLLGGVNWRVFQRGLVRAAVAAGLSDGAPDSQFLVGYASQF